MEQNNQQPQDKDRHLDIPSEANRDKHINFRELESEDNDTAGGQTDEDKERQRQWREGLEAGKRARNNEGDAF